MNEVVIFIGFGSEVGYVFETFEDGKLAMEKKFKKTVPIYRWNVTHLGVNFLICYPDNVDLLTLEFRKQVLRSIHHWALR